MDYQEALAYIYSFSDYERGSKYSRDRHENLLRETALLELLGNPHQPSNIQKVSSRKSEAAEPREVIQAKYTSTLIAGTKGKGSTAAYIERVLREAGVRTGLYTQPDLHTFRERIQVNGRLISEEEVGRVHPRNPCRRGANPGPPAIRAFHYLRNRYGPSIPLFCSSARPACSDRSGHRWTPGRYQCDPSSGLGDCID